MNVFITKKCPILQRKIRLSELSSHHMNLNLFLLAHNIPQESKPWNIGLSTTLEKFNIDSNCSSFRPI